MSRWIEADAVRELLIKYIGLTNGFDRAFSEAPSIDIVRCKECRWIRYCETEDLDLYLDCDKSDGGGIPRSEEWFCADGERKESE